MRELPQLSESATRRETSSSAAREIDRGTDRDLGLVSSDEWPKFTAETIEIRRMVYGHRKLVLETPDDE